MDIHSPTGSRDQEPSDGILVQRSVGGDYQAFAELAERYRPLLEGYVSRWCPDPHLIPDLVQGALLQLYLYLPTLHVVRSLKAWLAQVVHNCCEAFLRRSPVNAPGTSASRTTSRLNLLFLSTERASTLPPVCTHIPVCQLHGF